MSGIGYALLGRYKFIAELGRDEQCVVYLAQDLNIDSCWEVKEFINCAAQELSALKKEVRLLAALNHTAIPRVIDCAQIGNSYFVVTDFVGGYSLGQKVNIEGPMPESEVLVVAKKVCKALDFLHTSRDNPVIYRNLKPDNIAIAENKNLKLMDYRLARECHKGRRIAVNRDAAAGPFVAPEENKSASNILDERTDIYSLGATLFFLLTGHTPEKTFKETPRLRKLAPNVSEGIEFIISKCTAINPDDRYSCAKDVLADIKNVENLTSTYKTKIRRRLALFAGMMAVSLIFAVVGAGGYTWLKANNEGNYHFAIQTADEYMRTQEYETAAGYYRKAIEVSPEDRDAYVLLFSALLPNGREDKGGVIAKAAIDEIRTNYIENPSSKMYNDPQLMYIMVKYCVDVQDPVYADIAHGYIQKIKATSEYKGGILPARELQSYEVFASFLRQEANTENFNEFSTALKNLEEYTDNTSLLPDEKLNNYYTLISMYSRYLVSLDGAPEKINEVGIKARLILESSLSEEDIAFENVIPMYEMVARAQFMGADLYQEIEEKQQFYLRSIEWFGYLQELDADLCPELALKYANAHKFIFDLYNTPQNQPYISAEIKAHLEKAIVMYEAITAENTDYLEVFVALTQSYLDRELIRQDGQQNFALVQQMYMQTKAVKDSGSQHSTVTLAQFAALTRQLASLGIEVSA